MSDCNGVRNSEKINIYVAGHSGMVGNALVRYLNRQADIEGVGKPEIVTRTRAEMDLTDQQAVRILLADEKIDQVSSPSRVHASCN